MLTPDGSRGYVEFPGARELEDFDWDDRKFVAVSLAVEEDCQICNAVDSDYAEYANALDDCGVVVLELCPNCPSGERKK